VFLISRELEKPEHIRPDPFAFIDDLSRGQVAHLIKNEPVKVKAIVLSRVKADDTARILETLPKEVQLEVAVHIGNFQSLPLDMLEGVALDLATKAQHVPDSRSVDIEGPRALVDMMGRTSAATSLYLLQSMKSKDRKLSEQVEKRFMVFEAIPLVPDDILPQVVRTVPSSVVIQALQGAPQDIQRKVVMAFPEQARPGLVNSVKAAKFDAATIDEARRQLIGRFQTLAEQGRIDLKAISDAWQSKAKAS
jgi:flagellar motor switch protein FliG